MNKLFFVSLFIMVASLFCGAEESAISVILNHYGARTYVAGAIPKADMDRIVAAGVRAPSAGNRQPWHFTVVPSGDLAEKIVKGMPNGNSLIVISAESPDESVVLDCALAAQSVYLAAQALGYGSRIYTGPIAAVNKGLKKELGLGDKSAAVVIVRVGKLPPKTDAVSAASSRKAASSLVTYK
jgi:nitroreductase